VSSTGSLSSASLETKTLLVAPLNPTMTPMSIFAKQYTRRAMLRYAVTSLALSGLSGCLGLFGRAREKQLVIHSTDLYHPFQDYGDTIDLLNAYRFPGVELRGVVLDCTQAFMVPQDKVGPDDFSDRAGPRVPGIAQVKQLNHIFNADVPYAISPELRLSSKMDSCRERSDEQQSGIESFLDMLRTAPNKVHVTIFGSAHTIAAAYNREPDLLRQKVKMIHVCAGCSEPDYVEWNVRLDPFAMAALLDSDLPLAIYPCASAGRPFSLKEGNTFCQLENLQFVKRLREPLYRHARFAREKNVVADPLKYLDSATLPPESPDLWTEAFNSWELPIWLQIAGLGIKQTRTDELSVVDRRNLSNDTAVDGELHKVYIKSNSNGTFNISDSSGKKVLLFRRKNPGQYQSAVRSVLPNLLSRY
jgi:pyrimidine-specific ribonucleoside hydrolase